MGWVGDRIDQVTRRLAGTAADLPLQSAVTLHAPELRELLAIGVTLGRLSEALALAGVLGARTGKPISAKLLSKMLAKAPATPPVQPPTDLAASARPSAATVPATASPHPPTQSPMSRAGRGLDALAGRKHKQ